MPKCRLPTVDEWRAAVRSIAHGAVRTAFENDNGLAVNCSVNNGNRGIADVAEKKFKQGEHFSLLGNCRQICSETTDKCVLVGGSYLSSRDDCFKTIKTPEKGDKIWHTAGFRVVLQFH